MASLEQAEFFKRLQKPLYLGKKLKFNSFLVGPI